MKKNKLFLLSLLIPLLSGCDFALTPFCDHVDENLDHICDLCGKTTDHIDNDNDHNCDICGETFTTHLDSNTDGYCDICGSEMGTPSGKVKIELYGINDFHGAVTTNIGLINIGTYIKSKTDQPNTLFIDSGDTWQGSIESNLNRGNLITDVFSYAKLSARTIGNHDFDWGIDALRTNTARSYTFTDGSTYKIPTLGANIYDYNFDTGVKGTTRQTDLGQDYVIYDLPNGLKVGIIGVIGDDQITSISTKLVKDIYFSNHISKIKELSDYLRTTKKCDIIIGSEHDGYNSEEDALTEVSSVSKKKYVDFVFNGHTHQNEYQTVNGVTFAQCGANGDAVGHATLTYDYSDGSISTEYESLGITAVKNEVTRIGQNATIKKIVQDAAAITDPIGSEVLSTKFSGEFKNNQQLPNLMCEAIYQEAVKEGYTIDFAYCNNARSDITTSSGNNFTYKDLFAAFPFDNTVYIIKGKGTKWVNEINYTGSFVYNNGHSSIDSSTTYTVAALDYLAYHTNSDRQYDYFPDATEVGYLKKANGEIYTYREILVDYIKANSSKTFNVSDYSSSINKFSQPYKNPVFGDDPVITTNYGSETNPISVSQALDIAEEECTSSGDCTKQIVYCKGTVSDVGTVKSGYNENMYLEDSLTSETIRVYRIYYSGTLNVSIGDEIVIAGYIKNYSGNSIQFNSNNSINTTFIRKETGTGGGTQGTSQTYTINNDGGNLSGNYTNNYDSFTCSNIKINAYSFKSSTSSSSIVLNKQATYNDVDTMGGYLSNVTKINSISKITLTYKCSAASTLYYGTTAACNKSVSISSKSSLGSYTVNISDSDVSYFRFQANSQDLSVSQIEVSAGSLGSNSVTTTNISKKNRLSLKNYVVTNPSEGQQVSVPYVVNDNKQVVTSKTFTYHSFSWCQSHQSQASQFALTDPKDVAIYYTIFNKIPVNYGKLTANTGGLDEFDECGTKDEVSDLFDSDARCVSSYVKTTGYMSDIPYNKAGGTKPVYYEFDVKLATYSVNSRQSGRLVGVSKGLSSYSGDTTNVCFYTDDHYATFQEYLNTGSYGDRFDTGDSSFYPTSYKYQAQTSFTI